MKKFVAALYVAFPTTLLLSQTVSPRGDAVSVRNPLVDRIERLSKRFRPELVAPTKDWYPANVSRYCVYRSPDQKTLSIKPCQTTPRRFRLVPPLKEGAPATKPKQELAT